MKMFKRLKSFSFYNYQQLKHVLHHVLLNNCLLVHYIYIPHLGRVPEM